MKLKKQLVAVSMVSMLVSCGGGSGDGSQYTEKPTTEPSKKTIDQIFDDVASFNGQIKLPPKPDLQKSRQTVKGVDADGDGTRDYLQHVASQSIGLLEGVTAQNYNELLSVFRMLQPQDPPAENSINEQEIYCAYEKLPTVIKNQLSLKFLYLAAHDTKERKQLFYKSTTPTVRNLGAESCN